MYNKIFTKILDSSIWLEPTTTRLIWMTFIAAMDEDGFTQFASVANLAHRARVTLEEAEEAVRCLESPDSNSSDPDNDGRRLERVPGGWMVLNAPKYRDMVTRTIAKERTRLRVKKHREKKGCNAHVTAGNGVVTQSEAATATHSESKAFQPPTAQTPSAVEGNDPSFEEFWQAYPRKAAKGDARKAWSKHKCSSMLPKILTAIRKCKISEQWTKDGGQFIPYPASWLNAEGWDDELQPKNSNGSIRENIVPHIE